jgi:hypothetical protein
VLSVAGWLSFYFCLPDSLILSLSLSPLISAGVGPVAQLREQYDGLRSGLERIYQARQAGPSIDTEYCEATEVCSLFFLSPLRCRC